jgi:hypothetical protein
MLEVGTPVDVGQTNVIADLGTGLIYQVVASLSATDVTNSVRTFTLTRQQSVLFWVSVDFAVIAGTDYGYVWGDLDGRTTLRMKTGAVIGGGPSGYESMTVGFPALLSKGTHTAKLCASVGLAGTSISIIEGQIAVVSALGT